MEGALKFAATVACWLLILVAQLAPAREEGRVQPAVDAEGRRTSVVDRVVRDLCDKRVALLGEPPMHGFGRTLQFKVDVARRLVDECGYNAFFIESGAYDFLHIQKELKSRREVGEPMIAAAIGGLWANRDVEPLIPFLLSKVRSGALLLGGLDDQLGRGSYAQREMAGDLVRYLQGEDKVKCLAILERHTLWQYGSDAPYGPKDKALILGCLATIEPRLSAASDPGAREYDLAMVENLKRMFARDFDEDAQQGGDLNARRFNQREESMYLNFRWWMEHAPPRPKVIVWTATTHAARDLSQVPGQGNLVPLGSYVRREFKDDAFVLGFSASSGTYAMAGQRARVLSAAPPGSLESRAFGSDEAEPRYFDPSQIRALGPIPARPLGQDFKTVKWEDVLDGLVVFREERPPLTAPVS